MKPSSGQEWHAPEDDMGDQALYNQAIRKVTEQVHAEFGTDLLGILFAGSVAYGIPYKRSDLDFFILIRQPWRQRRTRFVDGVEVELFINPVQRIRKYFVEEESSSTLIMFAQGRVLHDPTGIVQT